LFVRLQQRLVGPLRNKRRPLVDLVHSVEHEPGAVCRDREPLFEVLDGRVHAYLLGLNHRRYKAWPNHNSVNGPPGRRMGTWVGERPNGDQKSRHYNDVRIAECPSRSSSTTVIAASAGTG